MPDHTLAEESSFGAAQSRRFACDRCHRHKLRCERSPVMVNGSVAISLKSCKRCDKAQVACQTAVNAAINNNTNSNESSSVPSKRKTPHSEHHGEAQIASAAEDEDPEMDSERALFLSPPITEDHSSDSAIYSDNAYGLDSQHGSLIDLEHFDFGEGFSTLDSAASEATPGAAFDTSTLGLHALNDRRRDSEAQGEAISEGPQNQYKGFDASMLLQSGSEAIPRPGNGRRTKVNCSRPPDERLEASGLGSQPSSSLDNSQEECHTEVLELYGLVFGDLRDIKDADVANALLSPDSNFVSYQDRIKPDDSIIHRALFASERLIELITKLRHLPCLAQHRSARHESAAASLPPRGSFSSSAGSAGGSSYFHRRQSSSSTSSSSVVGLKQYPSIFTQDLNHLGPNNLASNNNVGGGGGGSSRSAGSSSSVANLPVIMSFLGSYVGLLCIYRAILTHIHNAFRACEGPLPSVGAWDRTTHSGRAAQGPGRAEASSRVSHTSPQQHPAAAAAAGAEGGLAGYEALLARHHWPQTRLGSRGALEIRLRMEVLAHTIERIGDAWAGCRSDGDESSKTLFGRQVTLLLLQNMLAHEGFNGPGDMLSMGLGGLMTTLNAIRGLLRGNSSLADRQSFL